MSSHLPAPLPPPPGQHGHRVEALRAAMRERVLVLDGAMGTQLQNQNLKAADFGGAEYEGCNEYLVLTRPDVIEGIHAAYFAAGADVTETDSFGGTPLVLGEFGLSHKAMEINIASAKLALRAAEAAEAKDGRMRWVAGSIGPTTKAISVTGGITFEELVDNFAAQA
ncbi:MAG TPA: homocysteine S-methyltransferase family protein, partial [Archangium sp.]|nr:homocysteine S-methyltransferase family protein [Archangium sp.]